MKIKPTKDRLIVQAIEHERRLASGLYIPETAAEKSQHGEVMEIGPNVTVAQVGDQVLYSKFGGTEVELHGEKLLLLREEDVLGTIELEPEIDGEAVAEDDAATD